MTEEQAPVEQTPEQIARAAEIEAAGREITEFIDYKCKKHGIEFSVRQVSMTFIDARGPINPQPVTVEQVTETPQEG